MSERPWHVSILVPARNEEALLPRCLTSILASRARLPHSVSASLVVAVDCSIDRTAAIAERMVHGSGTVVYSTAGAVGHARALAANAALKLHRGSRMRHWLANTDADGIVPADWLVQQLIYAEAGYAAVAGTVDVDSFQEHGPEVPNRFQDTYLINQDGSHPHIHGANFGLRADTYVMAGGWQSLVTAEDRDLWGRLLSMGVKTLSTNRTRIFTSGRRVGRAPKGFADALSAHNETAA